MKFLSVLETKHLVLFVFVFLTPMTSVTCQTLPYVNVYNDFIGAHPYYENYPSLRPVIDGTAQMNVSIAVALNQLVDVDESRQVETKLISFSIIFLHCLEIEIEFMPQIHIEFYIRAVVWYLKYSNFDN